MSSKILRRLIDFYLRRKVVEELKAKPVKEIKWFNIVLLELKEKMYKLREGKRETDSPIYSGNMYFNAFVFPTYKTIQYSIWHHTEPRKIRNMKYENLKDYLRHPIISYYVSETIKPIYEWDRTDYSVETLNIINEILISKKNNTQTYYREIVKSKLFAEQYIIIKKGKPTTITKMIEGKCIRENITLPEDVVKSLIKVRLIKGTMNLTKPVVYYLSPLNLKRWDAVSKKTSNKGLTADTTYSWEWNGHSRGWTFGGISACNLEDICKRNGFIKISKQKYNYGDYAHWYLHELL